MPYNDIFTIETPPPSEFEDVSELETINLEEGTAESQGLLNKTSTVAEEATETTELLSGAQKASNTASKYLSQLGRTATRFGTTVAKNPAGAFLAAEAASLGLWYYAGKKFHDTYNYEFKLSGRDIRAEIKASQIKDRQRAERETKRKRDSYRLARELKSKKEHQQYQEFLAKNRERKQQSEQRRQTQEANRPKPTKYADELWASTMSKVNKLGYTVQEPEDAIEPYVISKDPVAKVPSYNFSQNSIVAPKHSPDYKHYFCKWVASNVPVLKNLPYGQDATYHLCRSAVDWGAAHAKTLSVSDVTQFVRDTSKSVKGGYNEIVKRFHNKTLKPTPKVEKKLLTSSRPVLPVTNRRPISNKRSNNNKQALLTPAQTKSLLTKPINMNRSRRNSVSIRSAPVAKSTTIKRFNKPRMGVNNGNVMITHSEMFGHVTSLVNTYDCNHFVCNPGHVDLFPWLSGIANNFEKYKFHKLSVAFVSSVPTSIGGKVGLGIDYDSKDEKPHNRVDFFTLTHHTESAPWDNLYLDIPVKGGLKFIASDDSDESRLINMGQILVMSDLVSAAQNLGDLIVSYTVELAEPQPASFGSTGVASAGGYASLEWFGKKDLTYVSDSLGDGYFSIPSGSWSITLGARLVASNPTIALYVKSGEASGYEIIHNAVDTSSNFSVFTVTKQGTVIKIACNVSPENYTTFFIALHRIQPSVVSEFSSASSINTY